MPIDEFIITVFCWVELGLEKVTAGVVLLIATTISLLGYACPAVAAPGSTSTAMPLRVRLADAAAVASRSTQDKSRRQAIGRANEADPALAQAILAEFPYYHTCPAPGDSGALRYLQSRVDLNDDASSEVIALVLGRDACGSGGCTAFVFQRRGSGYHVNTTMTSVSVPILASDRRTRGWRDLIVQVSGGGSKTGLRVLRFNGTQYPSNPSVEPVQQVGKRNNSSQVLIASDSPSDANAQLLIPSRCGRSDVFSNGEALGWLRLGVKAEVVREHLGAPTVEEKLELWDADNRYHGSWQYPSRGITIGLAAETPDAPLEVDSVRIVAPSTLKTSRGIGIGATFQAVAKAYRAGNQGKSENAAKNRFSVDSEYGDLSFEFDEHGLVRSIYLGASAE